MATKKQAKKKAPRGSRNPLATSKRVSSRSAATSVAVPHTAAPAVPESARQVRRTKKSAAGERAAQGPAIPDEGTTHAQVALDQSPATLVLGDDDTNPLSRRVISSMEAARELKMRRTAKKSLMQFCKFTHPHYHDAWFHAEVAKHVENFLWGRYKGLQGIMVFMPPRHGKSELIAIRTPAWDLGEHPAEHYIAVAYGDELATTFSRACRNIIETPSYQRLWKHTLKTRGDTKWELRRKDDDQRATYISSGILSALTGEGATRMVIDDPVKNAEEAYSKKIRDKIYENYRTAAETRMAPRGKKMLVMTRWHEDDLAGRLLARAIKDKMSDQWLVIVLAATNDNGEDSYIWNTLTGEKTFFPAYKELWAEAYPREDLDRIRANQGPVNWQALYMQRPQAPTGGIFKRENWGYYDQRPPVDLLVQVYDTAFEEGQENDYSASITLGATVNTFPIYDAWRDKVGFPFLVAKVYERWAMAGRKYGRFPERIVVEKKGSGHSLIQQIETNNLAGEWTFPKGCVLPDGTVAAKAITLAVPVIPVTPMPAQLSKVVRAQGISGYHESKCLLLPNDAVSKAEWVDDFIDEHALFDKGPHDDWVDTTVHGVTYYVRPAQDHEEIVTYGEPISIARDLDEYEMEQAMMGRGW